VDVGYADDTHVGSFFPSPWGVGGTVQYQNGMTTGVDAGAIKINNTGVTSISIDDLTIDGFGDGAVFHIWGSNGGGGILAGGQVLAPGMSAIFTQTAQYNFDSSDDQGSNTSAIPVVHVTIDGVAAAYMDTAQILNTEGTDHLASSNEDHQWRPIGTFGGQAAPLPSTAFAGMVLMGAVSIAKLRRRQAA
jgi:hypothetical protein